MNDNWWKAFAVAIVFIVIFAWLGILTSRSQCCGTVSGGGSGGVNPQALAEIRAEVIANNYWHREQLYEGGGTAQSGWPFAIAEEVDRLCEEIKKVNDKIDAYHPTGVGAVAKIDLNPCPDPAPKQPPDPPPPFP